MSADSTPRFSSERAPTRYEAIMMLVCLLGKETEALHGEWTLPFTDVDAWARPYVGYAYANGLIPQTEETVFCGDEIMTTDEYLAFLLPALGYRSTDLGEQPSLEAGREDDAPAEPVQNGLAGILHSTLGYRWRKRKTPW